MEQRGLEFGGVEQCGLEFSGVEFDWMERRLLGEIKNLQN
jgi:hypothetical protein